MARTPTPAHPVVRQRSAGGRDVAVRARPGGARVVERTPAAARLAPHAVQLTGLATERGSGPLAPTLVERREEDFVRALLAQLRGANGVDELLTAAQALQARPVKAGTPLTLYPPLQRVHHLVLVEACCREPGFPRLDPRRIVGAGLVVRRVADGTHQAWAQVGRRPVGWQALARAGSLGAVHEDDDPDPAQRAPRLSAGHAWINARLAANRTTGGEAAPSERVVALHPLPPDICERLGRTLLFGWLPVGSGEVVDDDAPSGALPAVDDTDLDTLQQHLVHFLQAGGLKPVPGAGQAVQASWLDLADAANAPLEPFVTLLLQLRNEFDAFGASAESQALARALQALRVLTVSSDAKSAVGPSRVTALVQACLAHDPRLSAPTRFSDAVRLQLAAMVQPAFPAAALDGIDRFLRGLAVTSALPLMRDAAAVLVGERSATVRLPDHWLPVSTADARAVVAACAASAVARFDRLFVAGRSFSESGERYAARCFVRVARDDGCPPELVWSGYGREFTVAPWWESSGVKPRVVPMPDPFDRSLLRALKPGVAFRMPARLANLMTRANLKKIDDGDKPAAGLAIDWICGFNIPIITLCALVVLHVFLLLLNIVFWWLPFIKVCIPLPRSK